MGRVYDEVTEGISRFIEQQSMFFVATAPLSADGHVNLSPKGLDTFRVLGPHRVAYLDLTGSGAETIAHLRENGRITVMFCAFSGPARIVRLYGSGEILRAGDEGFEDVASSFESFRATRAIIVVNVERIADSCGYGVPEMDVVGNRSRLIEWASDKTEDDLVQYWQLKNSKSIDALPALSD